MAELPDEILSPVRRDDVAEALCQGRTMAWIRRHFAEKWGRPQEHVSEYIRAIGSELAESAETSPAERRARLLAACWRTARMAEDLGDVHGMIKALALIAKIDGLAAPIKIDATHTINADISVMVDRLLPAAQSLPREDREALRGILSRMGAATPAR